MTRITNKTLNQFGCDLIISYIEGTKNRNAEAHHSNFLTHTSFMLGFNNAKKKGFVPLCDLSSSKIPAFEYGILYTLLGEHVKKAYQPYQLDTKDIMDLCVELNTNPLLATLWSEIKVIENYLSELEEKTNKEDVDIKKLYWVKQAKDSQWEICRVSPMGRYKKVFAGLEKTDFIYVTTSVYDYIVAVRPSAFEDY